MTKIWNTKGAASSRLHCNVSSWWWWCWCKQIPTILTFTLSMQKWVTNSPSQNICVWKWCICGNETKWEWNSQDDKLHYRFCIVEMMDISRRRISCLCTGKIKVNRIAVTASLLLFLRISSYLYFWILYFSRNFFLQLWANYAYITIFSYLDTKYRHRLGV